MGNHDSDRFRVQGPTTQAVHQVGNPSFELDREQSKLLDRLAVERYAIPSILLMENAAIGLRDQVLEMIRNEVNPFVMICCGPGNNGGDGMALARQLHNAQIRVRVVCTQAPGLYKGDAGTNRLILDRMGIETTTAAEPIDRWNEERPYLIVDALFGTGLDRPVEGIAASIIDWMNSCRKRYHTRVMCVDLPSGIDADTGEILGDRAVKADMTVTMAALKPCMARVEAHEYLGEVRVASIGVPIELLKELGTAIEPRHRD